MEAGPISLIILLMGTVRVWMHFVDKRRVVEAANERGWQRVEVHWEPFASGWFFEKGERHYRVLYRDEDGEAQDRICKTSLFTGVYWRD